MQKWVAKWWKSYKFRFVPWIALNVKHEPKLPNALHDKRKNDKPFVPVHHMQKSEEVRITGDNLTQVLTNYFSKCRYPKHPRNMEELKDVTLHNKKVMKDHFGFVVERRPSQVSSDAGTGVFITEGVARKGSIVGNILHPLNFLYDLNVALLIKKCPIENRAHNHHKYDSNL